MPQGARDPGGGTFAQAVDMTAKSKSLSGEEKSQVEGLTRRHWDARDQARRK